MPGFAALLWLLLGLVIGLITWPQQLLSELGFVIQRAFWLQPGVHLQGPALVFAGTFLLVWAAWQGPLAPGRGGGVAPVLVLDRSPEPQAGEVTPRSLELLSLDRQLRRLALMVLSHAGGLAVGIESPAAALGASLLLALRRLPRLGVLLQPLPPAAVAVIGGSAGLGAAFRSPLLGVLYGLEELGRQYGLRLLLPVLLAAGSGTLVATRLGQPARLPGLLLGELPLSLWGWALLLVLVGALAGGLLVKALIVLRHGLKPLLRGHTLLLAFAVAACLTLLALCSGGWSLNDGSLLLGSALRGEPQGSPLTWLWRALATLISVAAGAPGGIMHDAMTLGALLVIPLQDLAKLDAQSQAQLAAVGATALFAAANGTPTFCAVFVFTLQGDPSSLPLLLLVSALSAVLAQPLRGPGLNGDQAAALLRPGAG